MKVDVHHRIDLSAEFLAQFNSIHRHLHNLEKRIMATLDQILTDVTDESTQLDSLSTLLAGLKQQIADALSGVTVPAAIQSKIDAVFNQAEINKGKIATALNANVPPPVTP